MSSDWRKYRKPTAQCERCGADIYSNPNGSHCSDCGKTVCHKRCGHYVGRYRDYECRAHRG